MLLTLFGAFVLNGRGRTSNEELPWAYGCEPRIDYSQCGHVFRWWCPKFYLALLITQAVPCVQASYLLFADIAAHLSQTRATAPHPTPTILTSLRHQTSQLSNDTVLQLKVLVFLYTSAGVIHHAALLTANAPRGTTYAPLAVEILYNLYNTFLVAALLGVLRYWRESMMSIQLFAVQVQSAKQNAIDNHKNRRLLSLVSWHGGLIYCAFTFAFCILSDSAGLLSFKHSMWRLAVRSQHLMFSLVCFSIAIAFLRIGWLLEQQVSKLVHHLTTANEVVGCDSQLQHSMSTFRFVLKVSYMLNGIIWIACFNVCGLGGVFFDTFYTVIFWSGLTIAFNVVGLLFAVVVFVLASPLARDTEMYLQDLLLHMYELSQHSPASPSQKVANGDLACISMPSASVRAEFTISDQVMYPCYVMPLDRLQKYARIPSHEEALRDGNLVAVTSESYYPCRAYCYFISHTWIPNRDGSRTHPDGDESSSNPKLRWLKEVMPLLVLADPTQADRVFIWMDYLSVPQADSKCQELAIMSLPGYIAITSRFIPLIPRADDIYDYQRRGWCSIEMLCAFTPKQNRQGGSWRLGPVGSALCYQFYRHTHGHLGSLKSNSDLLEEADQCGTSEHLPSGMSKHVSKMDICLLRDPLDPTQTDFSKEEDRRKLQPLIRLLAHRMAQYEVSGSTAYSNTFDVSARPEWCKSFLDGDGVQVSLGLI